MGEILEKMSKEATRIHFDKQVENIEKNLASAGKKEEILKNLDLFVLDNSLRETTVGQLRGHTIENKWEIYEQVKRVGFNHSVVASFSHMTRIGDTFIEQLREKGEDMSNFYAFSEFADDVIDNMPNPELPIGLRKCKELGINHVIIEVDLVYYAYDYTRFTKKKMRELFDIRFKWIRENLSKDSRILVNLRDLPDAMKTRPKHALKIVNFVASYRPQIFAILFEESGKYLPEVLGVWTKACKDEINRCKFTGHFLVHVHKQWGFSHITQLEILANGCDGIWAGVCDEGASMGHASSCLTILNLIRMGNTKVLKSFNCKEVRKAAIEVTKVTTGKEPHPKQQIYGARAIDQVFGLPQFDPDETGKGDFSLTEFLGIEAIQRITTLADEKMIVTRLEKLFGADPQFNLELAGNMKKLMLEDLRNNVKNEYHSPVGIALLFDRAGGEQTAAMAEEIEKVDAANVHIKKLIDEIRANWDEWDMRDGTKDDFLDFNSFYNGFMAPFFGCYRCDETKRALTALDMDNDGVVDWNEFAVFLKWAGHQYPDTETSEELLDIAFREGLIPSMQTALFDTKDKE